ncbi:MAG: hypothetical protein AVDCRST_MAG04-3617, partial [uncultured Acetobacteraceae bacterium]
DRDSPHRLPRVRPDHLQGGAPVLRGLLSRLRHPGPIHRRPLAERAPGLHPDPLALRSEQAAGNADL